MPDFTTDMTSLAALDDSIVDIYDTQYLIASHSIGVMPQLANVRRDINASSIIMSKYPTLAEATTPLTDKAEVASTAMSDSKITLTPAPYGMSVQLTDVVDIATGGKATRSAVELVGINQARTENAIAMAACDASANKLFAGGHSAVTSLVADNVLTPSLLHKLYNKMSRAGVPRLADGQYVLVIHPDCELDLKDSSAAGSYNDITKYSRPDLALRGQVAELAGFKILVDNQCSIGTDAGTGDVDSYNMVAMGYNGLGQAISQNPQLVMGPAGDKLNRFYNVGWKAMFQYKIVDTDALWLGVCASSIGSNT